MSLEGLYVSLLSLSSSPPQFKLKTSLDILKIWNVLKTPLMCHFILFQDREKQCDNEFLTGLISAIKKPKKLTFKVTQFTKKAPEMCCTASYNLSLTPSYPAVSLCLCLSFCLHLSLCIGIFVSVLVSVSSTVSCLSWFHDLLKNGKSKFLFLHRIITPVLAISSVTCWPASRV